MKIDIKYLFIVTILLLPLCLNAQGKYEIVKLINIKNRDLRVILSNSRKVQRGDTLSQKEFDKFKRIVITEVGKKNSRIDICEVRDIEEDTFFVKSCSSVHPKEEEKTTNGNTTLKSSNPSEVGWLFSENPTADIINEYPEMRAAFLIGNSDYSKSEDFHTLPNVIDDIEGVGKRLNELGFDVYKKNNVDLDTMIKAIYDICNKNGKKYDFVLFYYAGHGKRFGDKDFIIPVNAKDKYDWYADKNKINCSLDGIITEGHNLIKNGIEFMIVIDACRTKFVLNGNEWIEHETTPKFDSICLMQSTLPSNTATDAKNIEYTPFAEAFINICGSTGKSLEYELREIVDSVEFNSKQRPTIKNTIPRNSFFFYPKDSIPEKMKAKYYKTYNEAKEYYDNKEYGYALPRFQTLPISFNDSVCTYLAVCNYYWDKKHEADSLFKLADSAYQTIFFSEEYGKYKMGKDEKRDALNIFLKNADTSKAKQKSCLMVKEENYSNSNNWIKDSIGILYEDLANNENDSNKKKEYLDSAFLWYERSNSPYARYRRLELVNKNEVSCVSNKGFKYETRQYRQLKRIIKKYNDYDAKYCLGKFNIENSKFSETSRMHKIGVKWLEEDSIVGFKKAKKLLEQKMKPENNESQITSDSNSRSFWSKWWDYTREEWKFSDYWGVNVLYGNKGIDIAGHYRHKNLSIGFGYGLFCIKHDEYLFADTTENKRAEYIHDHVHQDIFGYGDSCIEKKPWMVYVEPGYNLKFVTISLGLGAFKLNRRFDFWYYIDYHNGDNSDKYTGHEDNINIILYPQVHFHWLFTEIIHWRWGLGLTIDVGYRQLINRNMKLQKNEGITNRNEIIKQYRGLTFGLGLEFAF